MKMKDSYRRYLLLGIPKIMPKINQFAKNECKKCTIPIIVTSLTCRYQTRPALSWLRTPGPTC